MRTLGRYELIHPLAKGGMAEVYLARRRVAGIEKRLVIKRMRRDRSHDPRFLDLFVREARLSMALVQQNIVPVFDFGRIGDDVFLAMEHIDGKDLGSTLALDRSAGLPPLCAAFVAAECCKALDHAHHRRDAQTPDGVIHRDVTPRNVLVSWAGEVLLADFGIAAVVGEATGSDALGTPGYMAPEQARGEPIDARTDVYALGMVLWEAVTGTHVRPSESRTAALAAARSGELPEVPASVPAGLAAVIRTATAKDPAARYANARDMADALDAFVVGERARLGGPPPARQLGEWLRERWREQRASEEPVASGEELGAIVTFLDDGEGEVLGTRTARSVAETQDGGPASPPAPSTAATVATGPPEGLAIAARAADPSPAARASPEPAATTTTATPSDPVSTAALPRRARARRRATAALVVASAGAALILYASLRSSAGPGPAAPAGAPVAATFPAGSAAAIPSSPIGSAAGAATGGAATGSAATGEAPGSGAATTAPGSAAATGDARPRHGKPDGGSAAGSASGSGRVASGSAHAALPTAAPARRSVTLNAVPWANITIDRDPTVHETPVTVELTVGPHEITYANPQLGVTRTVTFVVPADGPARHVETLR